MKVCFTGHRPEKLPGGYDGNKAYLQQPLAECLRAMTMVGPIEKAYCGMALGFDQVASYVCMQIRIPVVACVPCKNYEMKWPQHSQDRYKSLLEQIVKFGGEIVTLQDDYTPQCLQLRNIYMVDNADVVVACWDGTSGGTANCIKYAESKGKHVINIWDEVTSRKK